MAWITLTIGDETFPAQLLAERSPASSTLLENSLPLTAWLVQDEWSGALLHSTNSPFTTAHCSDRSAAYQYPGLLFLQPDSGQIGLCYGQARFQTGTSALPVIPLAEIPHDHTRLAEVCALVQFRGATELRVGRAHGSFPLDNTEPTSPRITVQLGSVTVTARLLSELCPELTSQFLARLPLEGVATNTHSSGPLTRFWNNSGGSEGETPLEPSEQESDRSQVVLYPGHIYYQPNPPWRGLRIATGEATMMRSAVAGGGLRLFPLARIESSRADFDQQAARLIVEGAKPFRISHHLPSQGPAAADNSPED